MRKALFIILFLVLLFAGIIVGAKPLASMILKRQVLNVWPDATLSFENIHLGTGSFGISRFSIRAQGTAIEGKAITLKYSLTGLFRREITGVRLSDAKISVKNPRAPVVSPNKKISVSANERARAASWKLDRFECENVKVDINAGDLKAQGRVSMIFHAPDKSVERIDLQVDSLEWQGLQIKNMALQARRSAPGIIRIAAAQYDKNVIQNLQGQVYLEKNRTVIDQIDGSVWNGGITGQLVLEWSGSLTYEGNLQAREWDIASLVQDYKLTDRFLMNGKVIGGFHVKGQGLAIEDLSGQFSTEDPGGILVIKDKQFLENLASQTDQPLEILMESFQDYEYSKGHVRLGLEDHNVVLGVELDGAKGKRNLTVVVHNFLKGEKTQ
jgi:hypothetical protein